MMHVALTSMNNYDVYFAEIFLIKDLMFLATVVEK